MTTSFRRTFLVSLVVGLATLVLMLATEPKLAIVWDEGYTLGREARLRAWFQALRDPPTFASHWKAPEVDLVQKKGAPPPQSHQLDSRWKLLTDPQVLAYFWPFAREEPHGHPPFYAILGLTGDLLAPSWQDLPRARLGPILLFSFTAAVIFGFAAGRWSLWPAIAATSAWIFQPNLFGHGHYAAYDGVLSSLWILAIVVFAIAVKEPATGNPWGGLRWPGLLLGLILGCALATKLTGWFLPLPFLAWSAWRLDRRAFRLLLIALPLSVLVLYALNPPWWSEPITGVIRFFESNRSRGQTIAIPVQFLGTIYQTPNESLPWYNTLVWTGLVTPVGFLMLALSGLVLVPSQRRREPLGLLIAAQWLLLMVLRALPHIPGHDGVRMFLPAFGVLSLLVGLGARHWIEWFGTRARGLVMLAAVEGIASIAIMMPVPLSYFSPVVGGLPGAVRLGMEPTYYWDGLTKEALDWLEANTPSGQSVFFGTNPTSWYYLRQSGALSRGIWIIDRTPPAWYVMQNRPGAWLAVDRRLFEHARPVFSTQKLGVPLVLVYRIEDWQEAARAR